MRKKPPVKGLSAVTRVDELDNISYTHQTPFPPAQSENTKMILDQIDQASNSDTPPISMKAMMASLRSSLENDRNKHIYNAGAYANSLGSYAWEPEESDD